MQTESLTETIKTGAENIVAQAGVQATKMKDTVQETVNTAVEDGVATARRAIKVSRRAAEDLVDDAQHEVRQNPLRAIGITLGIGFGVGALIGLLASRRSSNS